MRNLGRDRMLTTEHLGLNLEVQHDSEEDTILLTSRCGRCGKIDLCLKREEAQKLLSFLYAMYATEQKK